MRDSQHAARTVALMPGVVGKDFLNIFYAVLSKRADYGRRSQ